MKFLVTSALDFNMTEMNYEELYDLKLYRHFNEDEEYPGSNQKNIYYIETDSIFQLYSFMNKTEMQRIIFQKEISNCIFNGMSDEDQKFKKSLDGMINIYNTWVE